MGPSMSLSVMHNVCEGKLLKTVQNNLKTPYSVKIIQNQLYVADRSDLVKIFDTDCNVVGTIQTKECPGPYDITVGEDGLYIAGSGGKIAVYRCAPNGEFIRHLNINPPLNLSTVRSICLVVTSLLETMVAELVCICIPTQW